MFGLLTDIVSSTLGAAGDILEDVTDGELPSRRDLARLIDAGITIAVIACALNVSESVIDDILNNK